MIRAAINDDDLRFYTCEQVARMLQTTRPAVYAMIARGRLRAVHIGRRILIRRAEILRLCGDC